MPASSTPSTTRRAAGQIRPVVGWTILAATLAGIVAYSAATYDGRNPVVDGICAAAGERSCD